ncbi:MAG: PAS domain S-box protein [Rubrivivax sp.]|nr:PAS domain S-box protein [Rubrivivax sp.]
MPWVTVLDRQRTVLLRSSDARTFVGHRRPAGSADPLDGQREGFDQAVGRDGVLRVLAFVTLPGSEWQVVAGLPASEVFADYQVHLYRTAAIALAVALLGLTLAWRLSTGIAAPMAGLAATARDVAAGDLTARAELCGPTEVITVAEQFNRMLDARIAAEAALRESEQRYRTLVDWSPEALSVHRDGKVLFVNPAAVALLGAQSADELIGCESIDIVPNEARPDVLEAVQSAIAHGDAITRREQRLRRRDGAHVDVEVHGTRIVFNGGPALIASMRDITKRKQVEAELRESEARQRRLLTLLPVAVFVVTDDRVTFANEASLELFGRAAEAVLGKSPLTLLHPDSVELARSRTAALRHGAAVAPLVEMKIVRADGGVRVVETMGTPIEEQGEKSVLVVMRDVTDLQQAQLALAQSHADLQRLFTAEDRVQEDERKRIARELHDDLQQTLAAIRMNLKAAGERLAANPQGAVELLAEVDALAGAAIASTRRIVNDLRPPIIEDLGLAAALEMLAAQFRQHSGIDCVVELHDDGGAAVEVPAVATSLYRVAQESLNNVLKHANARQVTIRLGRNRDDRFTLCIHDDGVGFNVVARHKPRSFGLLGMAERIRALGGALHIESQPGSGTTIEVLIPADRPGPPPGGTPQGF